MRSSVLAWHPSWYGPCTCFTCFIAGASPCGRGTWFTAGLVGGDAALRGHAAAWATCVSGRSEWTQCMCAPELRALILTCACCTRWRRQCSWKHIKESRPPPATCLPSTFALASGSGPPTPRTRTCSIPVASPRAVPPRAVRQSVWRAFCRPDLRCQVRRHVTAIWNLNAF